MEDVEIGASLSSIANVEIGRHFLEKGSYHTFYGVRDTDVYVDRVLYGRWDNPRILFGDAQEEGTSE